MQVTTSSNENISKLSQSDYIDSHIVIDTGANLTNRKFQRDLDNVISRSVDAGKHRLKLYFTHILGVKKIIVTSINTHYSKEALRLSQLYPGILYCSAGNNIISKSFHVLIGVSPHEAKTWNENTAQELTAIATNPECVAVGICGLDLQRPFSDIQQQVDVFRWQVGLAVQLKKPLLVYEKGTQDQIVEILQDMKDKLPAIVIQSFTEGTSEALAYLKQGFYLTLSGSIWKETGISLLQNNVIPLNRLLFQSEAPHMCPNPRFNKLPSFVKSILSNQSLHRLRCYCSFQRNEPCCLPATLELAAALMQLTPADLAFATTYNAVHLFGLTA